MYCGLEFNQQSVILRLQGLRYIESKWNEHIICFADEFAIQPNAGYCIEAVEDQVHLVAVEQFSRDVKDFSVYPGFFADPGRFFGVGIQFRALYLTGFSQAVKDGAGDGWFAASRRNPGRAFVVPEADTP